MAKRMADPKREQFWRKALQRREKSGLTVAEFCRQEGLAASAYYFWRREINRRDEAQEEPRIEGRARSRPSMFAPLRVVEDERPSGVEVARNGWLVRISEEATAEHIRRVLQLVREIS